MDTADLQRLAPPGVTALVAFLALTSQWLFYHIEPGPLKANDALVFNILVSALLVCYWRTCLTDPGQIPKDWPDRVKQSWSRPEDLSAEKAALSNRWCRRCEILKPPRAHHCKTCKRCILKMDHHCVWTANCVSHITIPHFVRFLAFAVMAMAQLEYFLYIRGGVLWNSRRLPSYLGPSVLQLAHLFILVSVNSFVLFMLVLLLGRTLWSLVFNTWTIEGWEIERHHTLLRRARGLGGNTLSGPDGRPIVITHQEFPWDVGVWTNLRQGMGNWNPLAWFWPFASSQSVESGLSFQHNEIDDPSKPWPPPDPDRLYKLSRRPIMPLSDGPFTHLEDNNAERIAAFQQRQATDFDARYADADGEYVVKRMPFHERLQRAQQRKAEQVEASGSTFASERAKDESILILNEEDGDILPAQDYIQNDTGGGIKLGEEAWRNQEGERLADFGVDEEADFYDETDVGIGSDEDVPLAELIRRGHMK